MGQGSSLPRSKVRAIEVPRLTGTLYIMLALIFLVFSFWNGLFFDTSFMAAAIYFTIVVIMSFLWLKQNRLKISGWLTIDYLVFAYFAIYFISALFPANAEYAVLGFVRGITYLFFYILLRTYISIGEKRKLFLDCLVLSGALFALYGLANGFGTLQVNGAIFDPQLRRLAANFEYSNTFAIYQGIMFLFAVTLTSYVPEQSKRKVIYEIAAYFTLVTVVLTYSRGTWLALAVMIVFMLLLTPKENKGKILLYTMIPLIVTVGTLTFLSKATLTQKQFLGWGTIFVGSIAVVLITWFSMQLRKRLSAKQWKMSGFGIGILIITVGALAIAKYGLPQNFIQRIASINLQQFSVVQRFVFFKDGLKVLTEHPLFGAGPNAWVALWQRYQSYPYTSRQSHSVLIDTIMNVGVVGCILFLAILVCTVVIAIRTYRKEHVRNRLLTDSLVVALVGLMAHGAIDFDFSYGTINFLMWALVAMMLPKLSIQQANIIARRVETPALQKVLTYSGMTLSIVGALIAGSFLLSDHYLKKANANVKDATTVLNATQNAVAIAPYRASAWLADAKLEEEMYKQTKKEELKKKIRESASNAAAIAPHDPVILGQAAYFIGQYGDGSQALETSRQAWENAPYKMQYAEQYMAFTHMMGTQLYQKDKNSAKKYLTNTLDTYHNVEQRIADFKNLPPVLKLEYPYEISPAMHLSAGEAAYYLGQYDEAKRVLEKVTAMQKASEQDKMKAKSILNTIK